MKYLLSGLCALLVAVSGAGLLQAEEISTFSSGNAAFNNYYTDEEWEFWEGFAYSNRTDTETRGLPGQYTAITGEGYGGSEIYAVGYAANFNIAPVIEFDEEVIVNGAYFTNNSYAYHTMLEGDDFTDPFGLDDWFKVVIRGYDAENNETGVTEVYLAKNGNPVDEWVWGNLMDLGAVKRLEFSMASSDVGDWGMNTPAYFAIDGITNIYAYIEFENLTLAEEGYWNGAETGDDDDDDPGSGGSSSSSTCFISTLNANFFNRSDR